MQLPEVKGKVERRLLVNYRVDPETIARVLPPPFRPQLVGGAAVAGICLIRLGELRPQGAPRWAGLRSENAAHRVAVEWDGPEGTQVGVYIPRRDSDSWVNVAIGGRLYPGEHHRARFHVAETSNTLRVGYAAADGSAEVEVGVRLADRFENSALFADIEAASAFFERGSVGYSSTRKPLRFEGLKLETSAWQVEPAVLTQAHSSFFEDPATFPTGTAELDCALVMREVPVVWKALADLRAAAAAVA